MTGRRSLSGACLAILLATLPTAPVGGSVSSGFVCDAYDQTAVRGRTPAPDGAGRVFPVVTIHGITGSDADFDGVVDKSYIGASPKPPRSLLDLLAGSKTAGETRPPGLPGVHVYSFSYTPDSLRWVDHERVGAKFAATVDCLYAMYGTPVSVVAHSMGGLVTRWLANTTDAEGRPRATKLGKVITLGTPYEGSLLSSIANGATDVGGAVTPALSVLNMLCGSEGTETGSGACGPIPLYASFRSEAGRNLQVGSRALADLGGWPAGVDVATLAGSQVVPLTLFGSPFGHPVVDIGDIAVQTASATADPSAGRVFECRYDTAGDTIRTELEEVLHLADPRDRQAKLTGAFLGSPCYHSNLMRNVELTNEVLGQLSDWLAAHRSPGAVTERELRSLVLPEDLCGFPEFPAGDHQLTDGRYAPKETEDLYLSIEGSNFNVGDLDGDGVADGALALMCANGVADKTDIVRVVMAKDRKLLDVPLTRPVTGEAFDPANEYINGVFEMSISKGTLEISMYWNFMDDALCCPTTGAFGTYELDGAEMTRSSVLVVDDRLRTKRLVDALNAGDRPAVAAQLADGWEHYFDPALDQRATFTVGACTRGESFSEPRTCELYWGRTRYFVEWTGGLGPDLPGDRRVALPIEYGD